MAKAKTQFEKRRRYNNRDQHGREWLVTVEKETNDPTGLIEPCFSAPIAPPQNYLSVPADSPRKIHIDYDRWIRDLKAQQDEWEVERYKIRQTLAENEKNLLDRLAGPAPTDWRVVELAQGGDKFLLGLKKPEWKRKETPREYLRREPAGSDRLLALYLLGEPMRLPLEEPAPAA